MFVVTPNGTLVNLAAVEWIVAGPSVRGASGWSIQTNVLLDDVSETMTKDEALALLDSIAKKLGAVRL